MKKLQWGHKVLYQLLKRLLLCFFQKLHNLGQVKMRSISQLIKVISKVHQKLLSYFNGKAIFCIYNACIVIFILKCWFEFELFGICYIIIWLISVINLQKFLNNFQHYYIKIFLIIYLRVICFSYAVCKWGTTFKYTCLLVRSVCPNAYATPTSTTVMFPVTSTYASLFT